MLAAGLALGVAAGCKKSRTDAAAKPAAPVEQAAATPADPPPTTPASASTDAPGAEGAEGTEGTPTDTADTAPPAAKSGGRDITAIGSGGKTKVLPMSSKVVADTAEYQIKLTAPARLTSSADSSATIEILPKEGWKLNHEFPTKLTASAPADVKIKKAEQTVADAVAFGDKAGRWTFEFKVGAGGDKSFTCKMKFAVCTDTTCDPKKQDLAWNVSVE
jgi:hypothetical protein